MASRVSLIVVVFGALAFDVAAQDTPKPDPKSTAKKKDFADELSITNHKLKVGDDEIAYTATAGTLAVKTDDGKPRAKMFFIAYTRSGAKDVGKRALTFCFNGGPGSSSVWLHMGMLGPKRIRIPDDASYPKPPYKATANPFSLLNVTDLVFIDPVSTGYSRPAEGTKKQEFHGYDEDIKSVGEFIHLYLGRYKRWNSPLFLCGESYGTTRAAGLSGYLQSRYNINLNGVVLVSAVLDFATIRFSKTNDLPHVLFLPGYTATAWYHKKLAADLQAKPLKEVVAEARQFASGTYLRALFLGGSLTENQRDTVAEGIAKYTGLSKEFVLRSNLRISMSRFGKELLRSTGETIGRFDSRYKGKDRDAAGERYEFDASGAAMFPAFTAALNGYLRGDLKFERDQTYEILTGKVRPWSYKRFENRYVDSSETLRQAMVKNPAMKVFVANGYYDLATPFFATEYTFDHLALPAKLRGNVTMGYYEGGHMMYVHEPSLKQLHKQLTQFYASAVARPE